MKLLKIENGCGHFRLQSGNYSPIDKISKDDLLQLVNATLSKEDVEFDEYDESMIQNHAHQVIYKSVVRKLQSLRERKQEFIDESARLYLEDYEKYKVSPTG
jgi:hypothetical protein